MRYDFDTIIDRSGTNAYKWDITPGELPMWVADMDFTTAPEITEAIMARAAHGVFGYSTVPDAWYEAYIDWWRTRHGITYAPQELIFSTGVIPIISSCVRKLTTPAEKVLVMTPVYNIFFNCIRNNGRTVQAFPLDYADGVYSIDFDRLAAALADSQTTLMLLCDPHNPIGRIWDKETLARIGALAYENGVTVISDEIHCDITDPGRSYVPFAAVSEVCRENCVVCISPTKTFNLAGLQTAAAVVPNRHLRSRVRRALNTDEVAEPNAFAVQAAVAAFREGGAWLEALRQYLYENKTLVAAHLTAKLPQIRLVPSEATYLLWLDATALGMPSDALAAHIRKTTGLYLSSGGVYGAPEGFLRMNIACPRAVVEDGLERLTRAVAAL